LKPMSSISGRSHEVGYSAVCETFRNVESQPTMVKYLSDTICLALYLKGSWRKGFTHGAIIVDLERRTVADVLKTRSPQAMG
jgi:hypothetical protein